MRTLLIGLTLAISFLAACSGGGSESAGGGSGTDARAQEAASQGAEVTLESIAFQPGDLEVEVGTTVTWTNQDDGVAHTVTSGKAKEQGVPGISEDKEGKPDGTFNGELDDAGDSYEFTFDKPGTYKYFCAIHAPMTGTIVVK